MAAAKKTPHEIHACANEAALIRLCMMASSEKGRYYCNHYGEKVSKTYFAHKKQYYDVAMNKWDTSAASVGVTEEHTEEHADFRFSDSDYSQPGIYFPV